MWCRLGDIGKWQAGATPSRTCKDYYGGNIPWLKTGDLNDGYIENIPEAITVKALNETSVKLNPAGSVLIAMYGATIGKIGILKFPATTNQACCACVEFNGVRPLYLFYFLRANRDSFIEMGGGGAQPNISKEKIIDTFIPIPPIDEQKRIIDAISHYFSIIAAVEYEQIALRKYVTVAKTKILDLALSGRLTSDTSHYPQLPEGWEYKQLDEVLDYEQPQKYIVESTEYSDDYATPVLTAGKSFIIGHTNEQSGICTDVPVIIFDDFTTDSKFVDFPFKVKSSAMKILHPKGNINLKYLAYFMSITRLVGTTHKRYWISEYSKIKIPVPPKEEQDEIVFLIEKVYSLMDSIFVNQS